jgi:adenosine kinase
MKILVSGSLAYDKIMAYAGRFSDHILLDKVHTLSVSFVTDNLSEHFGGTAGNIAYNLALVDEHPIILSSAGNDFDPYREWLERKGVDVSHIRVLADKPTAFATIMTDRGDNQITALYLGTMAEPCGIEEKDMPADAMAVVAAGNVGDMSRIPEMCRKLKIPFIYDPGQQITSLTTEELKSGIEGARAFLVNDYELSLAVKKTGWDESEMVKHAEMLVTTLAEEGSRIKTEDKEFEIPPAKAKQVLDPTGAGDAYRAGFLKGLIKDWRPEVIGRFAGVTAASAIEAYGAQGHKLTFHEARVRYADSFGEELPS